MKSIYLLFCLALFLTGCGDSNTDSIAISPKSSPEVETLSKKNPDHMNDPNCEEIVLGFAVCLSDNFFASNTPEELAVKNSFIHNLYESISLYSNSKALSDLISFVRFTSEDKEVSTFFNKFTVMTTDTPPVSLVGFIVQSSLESNLVFNLDPSIDQAATTQLIELLEVGKFELFSDRLLSAKASNTATKIVVLTDPNKRNLLALMRYKILATGRVSTTNLREKNTNLDYASEAYTKLRTMFPNDPLSKMRSHNSLALYASLKDFIEKNSIEDITAITNFNDPKILNLLKYEKMYFDGVQLTESKTIPNAADLTCIFSISEVNYQIYRFLKDRGVNPIWGNTTIHNGSLTFLHSYASEVGTYQYEWYNDVYKSLTYRETILAQR